MPLSAAEIDDLRRAKKLLESPGLAVKLTNIIGTPIEKAMAMLPERASTLVNDATTKSLRAALRLAVVTMRKKPRRASKLAHKALAIGSGAAGGFFGLPALVVELPISTGIILRSIADIARGEGENLSRPEARLACVEVFALGGSSRSDDAAETGYFAVRSALAVSVAEAAKFVAEKGIIEEGAPVLVRFVAQIASRFSVAVSEKIAAQAVPVIGAVGGAAVNGLFVSHFQSMATGHFVVRRLERVHGAEEVRRAWEEIGTPGTGRAAAIEPPRLEAPRGGSDPIEDPPMIR
jgi:hypothetical protein